MFMNACKITYVSKSLKRIMKCVQHIFTYACTYTYQLLLLAMHGSTCSVFAAFFSADFGLLVSALANKLSPSSSLRSNISLLPLVFCLATAFGYVHIQYDTNR